ncbi:MAG: hypothetical protein AAGB01_12085, partial [Cyanobacteria bacterium P01_F01_bin.42]
ARARQKKSSQISKAPLANSQQPAALSSSLSAGGQSSVAQSSVAKPEILAEAETIGPVSDSAPENSPKAAESTVDSDVLVTSDADLTADASPANPVQEAIPQPVPPAPSTARSNQAAGTQRDLGARSPETTPSSRERIPAASAVLEFFQARWQGQDNLAQSLSYRIVVQPRGTVSSVTPKDDVSSVQMQQAPLPAVGSTIAPSFEGPNLVELEVTLYPDGTVSVN